MGSLKHIGGNAIFLSNSVRGTRVSSNLFHFLGTSGVSIVGRTGIALADGRDGEAIVEKHGKERDNGVRLPQQNMVDHNVFVEYGIWDKQSACFHKALAPDNTFLNNVCFNSSRHAINHQDSLGGGGLVEGNVVFNLNRETSDTAAFNAWNRRNYLISDYASGDPAKPRLVPAKFQHWRRNLILKRNYHDAGYVDNGDGLRVDDGGIWYNLSSNVVYNGGVQFNGHAQVWTHGNIFIKGSWHTSAPLDYGGGSYDLYVESRNAMNGQCTPFWMPGDHGEAPAIYRGDHNVAVKNSTGRDTHAPDWRKFWCNVDLATWQKNTGGQDLHSVELNGDPAYRPDKILQMAREKLWNLPTRLQSVFV